MMNSWDAVFNHIISKLKSSQLFRICWWHVCCSVITHKMTVAASQHKINTVSHPRRNLIMRILHIIIPHNLQFCQSWSCLQTTLQVVLSIIVNYANKCQIFELSSFVFPHCHHFMLRKMTKQNFPTALLLNLRRSLSWKEQLLCTTRKLNEVPKPKRKFMRDNDK